MSRPKAARPNYRLSQHANGVWYINWFDGKPQRVSTGTRDEKAAQKFLVEWCARKEADRQAPPPSGRTLGDVFTGYLGLKVDDGEIRVHAPATLKFTFQPLYRHLQHLPVSGFTQKQADAYCKARRAEPLHGASGPYRKRPLSDATLRKELGFVKTACRWAMENKPTWQVVLPAFEMPGALHKDAQPLVRAMSRAQFRQLFDACTVEYAREYLLVAVYTAARKSAILELELSAIDWERRTIDFGPKRGKKVRPRNQPIADELYEVLLRIRQKSRSGKVIDCDGQSVASISKGFAAAAKRAGLPWVTPHVLKHTAISWMMQDGLPPAQISEYAGTTIHTLLKHYTHFMPDHLRPIAAALGKERLQTDQPLRVVRPPQGDLRIANAGQRAAMARFARLQAKAG